MQLRGRLLPRAAAIRLSPGRAFRTTHDAEDDEGAAGPQSDVLRDATGTVGGTEKESTEPAGEPSEEGEAHRRRAAGEVGSTREARPRQTTTMRTNMREQSVADSGHEGSPTTGASQLRHVGGTCSTDGAPVAVRRPLRVREAICLAMYLVSLRIPVTVSKVAANRNLSPTKYNPGSFVTTPR